MTSVFGFVLVVPRGAGVFLGDVQLKSMLQWMAASLAGRRVTYFRFQNNEIKNLKELADRMVGCGLTVGQLWAFITQFAQDTEQKPWQRNGALFEYLALALDPQPQQPQQVGTEKDPCKAQNAGMDEGAEERHEPPRDLTPGQPST